MMYLNETLMYRKTHNLIMDNAPIIPHDNFKSNRLLVDIITPLQ